MRSLNVNKVPRFFSWFFSISKKTGKIVWKILKHWILCWHFRFCFRSLMTLTARLSTSRPQQLLKVWSWSSSWTKSLKKILRMADTSKLRWLWMETPSSRSKLPQKVVKKPPKSLGNSRVMRSSRPLKSSDQIWSAFKSLKNKKIFSRNLNILHKNGKNQNRLWSLSSFIFSRRRRIEIHSQSLKITQKCLIFTNYSPILVWHIPSSIVAHIVTQVCHVALEFRHMCKEKSRTSDKKSITGKLYVIGIMKTSSVTFSFSFSE